MSADGLDLDGIRGRVDAATPGVWKLWGMTVMADQDGTGNVETAVDVARTFYRDEHGKPRTWDAEFIAHARTDVPALLAEVERLREALDWWKREYRHKVDGLELTTAERDEARAALADTVPAAAVRELADWYDAQPNWRASTASAIRALIPEGQA